MRWRVIIQPHLDCCCSHPCPFCLHSHPSQMIVSFFSLDLSFGLLNTQWRRFCSSFYATIFITQIWTSCTFPTHRAPTSTCIMCLAVKDYRLSVTFEMRGANSQTDSVSQWLTSDHQKTINMSYTTMQTAKAMQVFLLVTICSSQDNRRGFGRHALSQKGVACPDGAAWLKKTVKKKT